MLPRSCARYRTPQRGRSGAVAAPQAALKRTTEPIRKGERGTSLMPNCMRACGVAHACYTVQAMMRLTIKVKEAAEASKGRPPHVLPCVRDT